MDTEHLSALQALPESARSHCPIANVLDLFGDKWTLLIVRDLLLGKNRYGEFAASPEQIPTNLLASRLKRLEQAGIVEKVAYSTRPVRHEYRLTDKGKALLPILDSMADWAKKHIAGVQVFSRHR